MKKKDGVLKAFTLQFSGLADGFHEFDLRLDNAFIEAIEWQEPEEVDVDLHIVFEKRTTMLQLLFQMKGSIRQACDRCSEPLEILVESEHKLIAKFGDESYEETEEIIVIPSSSYQIDVSHFAYEFLSLSLPMRTVHSGEACDPIIEDYLVEEPPEEQEEETDPRWAALKHMKKDN